MSKNRIERSPETSESHTFKFSSSHSGRFAIGIALALLDESKEQ